MHRRQKMQRLILRMRAKIRGRQLTGMRHRDVWSTIQRSVSQKFILRLQRQTPGKLPGGLSIKATQKPSAGEQIIRWNVSQKTVGK